jgi:hypothetical protein
VVGSPWIGGAGRTSLTEEIIRSAPFEKSEIICLQYDIYANNRWSDDSKRLEELGICVVLTQNRTHSLFKISQQVDLPKLVICDGGWEDPGLRGYYRIGILPYEPIESTSQLWPLGEFRSLNRDHRAPDFPVYWATDVANSRLNLVSWHPVIPKNHVGERLMGPCILILSSGSQNRTIEDLVMRGFKFTKIVGLKDHSLKLESKVKLYLSQGHQVLIGHKERVKCSSQILQNPLLFILQDQFKVNWDWAEFWSSCCLHSQ